jgi:hypothetical protein
MGTKATVISFASDGKGCTGRPRFGSDEVDAGVYEENGRLAAPPAALTRAGRRRVVARAI